MGGQAIVFKATCNVQPKITSAPFWGSKLEISLFVKIKNYYFEMKMKFG